MICLKAMVEETTEWKKHVEANSSLMKRFEESRLELEKVLKIARGCMTERGNPEDLLKKHTVSRNLFKIVTEGLKVGQGQN